MSVLPCWACAEQADPTVMCPWCGAPPWDHRSHGPGGVYVVGAACGLVKIGMSHNGLTARVEALSRTAGETLDWLLALYGADMQVERWLQRLFADVRDPNQARAFGLPAHTEWFWPTPALERLARGLEFIRDGVLWEQANDAWVWAA